MFSDLMSAAVLVASPDTLLSIVVASFFGFVVGALPGLTATMAVALLIPITFLLSPIAAIASIVSAAGRLCSMLSTIHRVRLLGRSRRPGPRSSR